MTLNEKQLKTINTDSPNIRQKLGLNDMNYENLKAS